MQKLNFSDNINVKSSYIIKIESKNQINQKEYNEEIYKKKHLHIILSCAAVILWMILIFVLSAQPAVQSNRVSKKVTEVIEKIVNKIIPGSDFKALNENRFIRKNAHFFVYLILGILTSVAVRKFGVVGVQGISLVLLICVLYAMSDEFHQTFVPGRGPQIMDVLIDGAGAVVGSSLHAVIININKRLRLR